MSCLDDELLVRLSRGLVPAGELESADAHLDGCEVCRRVLASAVNEEAETGRLVGERYELGALVGAGAHGLVWEARDVKLERRVAVKLMRRKASAPLSEARLMARVSHPAVVQVFDVGEGFVAMEFVSGLTLRSWLSRGEHSIDDRVRVMREAGEALAAVHRAGLVHRDFKPDNVLIDSDGRARVTDFGLAQTESDGSIGGTPAYMAPEQLAGAPGDQKSDQYAFCVTLFEALSGRRPGKGAMPSSVPSVLIDVATRGLSKDPAARFGSIDELLAAMQKKPGPRWPWFAAAGLIFAVVIAALAVPRETPTPVPTPAPVAAPPKKEPPPIASPQLERDFLEEEPLVEALPPPGTELTIARGCVRTFKQPRLTKVFISNPDVVDAAGNEDELQLEAHEFGTSRVTLQSGNKKSTWTVKVREPIELPPTHVSLANGERYEANVGGLHRLSIRRQLDRRRRAARAGHADLSRAQGGAHQLSVVDQRRATNRAAVRRHARRRRRACARGGRAARLAGEAVRQRGGEAREPGVRRGGGRERSAPRAARSG
ncbi:MAG: serine/threonine-protein kinase [Archangium sp.]